MRFALYQKSEGVDAVVGCPCFECSSNDMAEPLSALGLNCRVCLGRVRLQLNDFIVVTDVAWYGFATKHIRRVFARGVVGWLYEDELRYL